jgi:hypothetical protein
MSWSESHQTSSESEISCDGPDNTMRSIDIMDRYELMAQAAKVKAAAKAAPQSKPAPVQAQPSPPKQAGQTTAQPAPTKPTATAPPPVEDSGEDSETMRLLLGLPAVPVSAPAGLAEHEAVPLDNPGLPEPDSCLNTLLFMSCYCSVRAVRVLEAL